uniref:FxsA family protein n=1 Tax=Thaumasiovibrio occultus TaxID=1891184 RepID=UPI000B34B38B|nr:FxsA family protein [Thaumasiovibrio occultus]
MFQVLLLLFIVVPIVEIALFIQVGGLLGLWPTVGLVLLTAVVGASLVRSQGIMTLMSVQDRLQKGEMPAQQIVEGVMLAVSGVLLLTPGFMTDALGMLVLLPAPRAYLAREMMSRVKVQSMNAQSGFYHQQGFDHSTHRTGEGDVFEGEFESKDEAKGRDDNSSNRLN